MSQLSLVFQSPQLTGVPHQGYAVQQPYSPQQLPPHMTSQRSITSQNSVTSSQGPPLQPPLPYMGQQLQNTRRYGSRGSLDDSSCTSSSPSLQSYKTSNSRNPEYDDGSSQRSTNGKLSRAFYGADICTVGNFNFILSACRTSDHFSWIITVFRVAIN